jgi:hypothetical protein
MPCIFDGLLQQSEDPRLNVILFPSHKFTQLFQCVVSSSGMVFIPYVIKIYHVIKIIKGVH